MIETSTDILDSPPSFVRGEILLITDNQDRRVNRRLPLSSDDIEQIMTVLGLLEWKCTTRMVGRIWRIQLELVGEDGSTKTVRIDSHLRWWNEGCGDWDLPHDIRQLLFRRWGVIESPSAEPPPTQQRKYRLQLGQPQ